MYRCEPVAISLWVLVAVIALYFILRAITGGEIFCNFPTFKKDGSYRFFINRDEKPFAFWTQVVIDIALVSLIGFLVFPSFGMCFS